jgi:hypothetical protein
MTLKGKKNHYNVKLLRGYGRSIALDELEDDDSVDVIGDNNDDL